MVISTDPAGESYTAHGGYTVFPPLSVLLPVANLSRWYLRFCSAHPNHHGPTVTMVRRVLCIYQVANSDSYEWDAPYVG